MGVLSHLEPQNVFQYFEEICAIPHASYQEGALSDYCAAFAQTHNLVYYQDSLKNIIIIKGASAGYESEEPLIIQGHLDMVCEKEPGCPVDFATNGISPKVEGDTITANGTTLGGDDGIAVAYALALLADDSILHPKLEVVLTVCEEVGLEGAAGIDVSMLEGRKLLNLDSEEEGVFLAGCAGGAGVLCRFPMRTTASSGPLLTLTVTGLCGGHSGTEIDKGRANANLLMGRILLQLSKTVRFRLAAWEGGKKDNAIPRTCSAAIFLVCDQAFDHTAAGGSAGNSKHISTDSSTGNSKHGSTDGSVDAAIQALKIIRQDIASEYAVTEKDFRLTIESSGTLFEMCPNTYSDMLDEASTRRALMLVNMLPNGIQAMSADVPGLVETSLNLGILQLRQTELLLHYAVRSSVESAKQALLDKLNYLTESSDGTVEISGNYPSWEYKRHSALRDKMIRVYEKMYGNKPEVAAIHAGVECGLFAGKIPGLDCISLGPNMQSVHTTEERLSISSVKRVWEYLLEVLKTK